MYNNINHISGSKVGISWEKLLTRKEAAEILGVKPETLATWSATKRYNLKYIKVGRLVKYRLGDLMDFLESRTREGGGSNGGKYC